MAKTTAVQPAMAKIGESWADKINSGSLRRTRLLLPPLHLGEQRVHLDAQRGGDLGERRHGRIAFARLDTIDGELSRAGGISNRAFRSIVDRALHTNVACQHILRPLNLTLPHARD